MSYEFYKLLHLLCLVLVISGISFGYFTSKPNRYIKIGTMVSSFLLMVAGMGLVAKLHTGWPLWIILKTVIWCILAISAPVLLKRFSQYKFQSFSFLIALFFLAIGLAVYQPF